MGLVSPGHVRTEDDPHRRELSHNGVRVVWWQAGNGGSLRSKVQKKRKKCNNVNCRRSEVLNPPPEVLEPPPPPPIPQVGTPCPSRG